MTEPAPAPVETSTSAPADEPSRWSDAHHLRVFVAMREVTCPSCRYNLRGLTSESCPECGQRLKLGVSLAEPFIAAWVALVVSLCLAAGPGVFVAIITMMEGPPRGPGFHLGGWLCYLYVLAAIPLAVVALGFRRPFCRLPRGVQGGIMLFPIAANLLVVAWLLTVAN
ncbi:MAG: hypothetical protein WD534_17265 [Phycisphaeraceae bacterium]